jgi:microsomal dipeptidase-like Zn-dependent dipeptidase
MNLDVILDDFLDPNEKSKNEKNDNKAKSIKNNDGLIEVTVIEKKLVTEDGRELLKEELPVSNSNKRYLI